MQDVDHFFQASMCQFQIILSMRPAIVQSGTKQNLVAKIWLPTLVFFYDICNVLFSQICSMWL